MDILNNIGFDWQVALVNFVNFLLIFWVLKKFVFPKISETLKNRKKVIEKGLQDAEDAKLNLENANLQKDRIIKEAKKEANLKIENSISLAKEKEIEILNKASEKSSEIIKNSENKAQEIKKEIIKSADSEITKLAILGAGKILGEK